MKYKVLNILSFVSLFGWAQMTLADESAQLTVAEPANPGLASLELESDYVLGINRFNLDAHTEIIGWQLSKSLYFGRQDGMDSGLTLVWQKSDNQVSLSKDGLRLTRRF